MKKTCFKKRAVALALALAMGLPNASAVAKVTDDEFAKVIGYDKGIYIQSPDEKFKLKVNIQLQPQYQFLSIEGANNNVHGFQIRRGRINFAGHAFTKDLTYRLQLEAVSGAGTTTNEVSANVAAPATGPNLREAWLNYKINNHLNVKGGQFKPEFNREELTSSTQLQFVDRSIVNDVFTHGYDLGLMFHGGFFDKKLEWSAYVTNENNSRNSFNANAEMLFGGRLVYNILGQHGYTMSDVKDSDEPQLAVGTAVSYNSPLRANEDNIISSSSDVAFRYKGFSLLGEFDYARDTTDNVSALGVLGQVGYFVIPEKLELAARVAAVFPTAALATDGYEFGGAANYFFFGHNVKLQMDYSVIQNSPFVLNGASAPTSFVTRGANTLGFNQDQTDHRFRTQVQLYF